METLTNNTTKYSFQVDSGIVQHEYANSKNYIIEYSDQKETCNCCAIYFSSHFIYFPNTEDVFRRQIVEKNHFEWFHTRYNDACKHIFVRDIFKQWYLNGINAEIDSPDRLLAFLKQETDNMNIVCIGSSAGAYAAIMYGALLNARRILAFNPQFEIKSLLQSTDEHLNPLLFRLRNTSYSLYFNLLNVTDINLNSIYYFYSTKSKWDIAQHEMVKHLEKINCLGFSTSHHGIPFVKRALPIVINLSDKELHKYCNGQNNPLFFSIKTLGLCQFLIAAFNQIFNNIKH